MKNKFYKGLINAWLLSVLFWGVLATILLAQPTATIVGPLRVPPGELTALSSTGSTGDNLIWIRPEGLAAIQAGCELMDQQLFFSTTRQGTYKFILVVADKEARIAYAEHTVVVSSETTPPTEPEPPTPTPTPGKWAGLVDVSKKAADAVNDPTTRQELKQTIEAKLEQIKAKCAMQQCPTLQQAQAEVEMVIKNTLLRRVNRFTMWESWRVSVSDVLKAKGTTDLTDYLNAVKAYASGL